MKSQPPEGFIGLMIIFVNFTILLLAWFIIYYNLIDNPSSNSKFEQDTITADQYVIKGNLGIVTPYTDSIRFVNFTKLESNKTVFSSAVYYDYYHNPYTGVVGFPKNYSETSYITVNESKVGGKFILFTCSGLKVNDTAIYCEKVKE